MNGFNLVEFKREAIQFIHVYKNEKKIDLIQFELKFELSDSENCSAIAWTKTRTAVK